MFGICLVLAGGAALLGPQMARNDLRSDLAQLSILKSWPLRGHSLIAGEVLGPAAILSVVAWLSILGALAVSAMIAIPAVAFVQLVIHNGAVVLFPAWVVTGPSRARGIEAMGQQMLMFAGTLLLLAVGLLPAAAVAGIIGLLLYWVAGWVGAVPAAILFAAVLVGESWIAIQGLGLVLERTDPSAVETAE